MSLTCFLDQFFLLTLEWFGELTLVMRRCAVDSLLLLYVACWALVLILFVFNAIELWFRIIFIAGMSYLISLRLALEYWVSNLECIMFQSTWLVFTQLHHLSWRADFEQPMTHRSSGTFPKQCLQDCSRSCLVKGLAQDGTHLVPESHQVWLTRCLDAFLPLLVF